MVAKQEARRGVVPCTNNQLSAVDLLELITSRVFFLWPSRTPEGEVRPPDLTRARAEVEGRTRVAPVLIETQRSVGELRGPGGHIYYDHGSQTRIFNSSPSFLLSSTECGVERGQSEVNKTFYSRLAQEGYSQEDKGASAPFLLPPFCSREGRRLDSANYQSQSAESVSSGTVF